MYQKLKIGSQIHLEKQITTKAGLTFKVGEIVELVNTSPYKTNYPGMVMTFADVLDTNRKLVIYSLDEIIQSDV